MLLFNGLGEFTHNELFQDPKTKACWCTLEKKSVIHFNLALILIGYNYSKGNDRATNDIMTQQ